jgi:hypothetical protein
MSQRCSDGWTMDLPNMKVTLFNTMMLVMLSIFKLTVISTLMYLTGYGLTYYMTTPLMYQLAITTTLTNMGAFVYLLNQDTPVELRFSPVLAQVLVAFPIFAYYHV